MVLAEPTHPLCFLLHKLSQLTIPPFCQRVLDHMEPYPFPWNVWKYVTPSHCISGQIVGRNRAIVALKWCEVSIPAVSIRMLLYRESSQLPYFWTSIIRFWGTEITNPISVAWLYVCMFLSWKNLLINQHVYPSAI